MSDSKGETISVGMRKNPRSPSASSGGGSAGIDYSLKFDSSSPRTPRQLSPYEILLRASNILAIHTWADAPAQEKTCAFGEVFCFYPVDSCEFESTPILPGLIPAQPGLPAGSTSQEGTRTSRVTGKQSSLGYRCVSPGGTPNAIAPDGTPIVITITQAEFASLPVQPLVAHAGPPDGWLPVNMDLILHAEATDQTLQANLLGIPVQIRAIPTAYSWDLGDGSTITTDDPGAPYPALDVTHRYRYEGWYDITLTTTFRGQFSVAGGPWQDIDGTIEVASDPVEVFSKSLESRLVNPDAPVDDSDDPWIPPRTPETEGPVDPEARGGS